MRHPTWSSLPNTPWMILASGPSCAWIWTEMSSSICSQIAKAYCHSEISEEWLMIIMIHFSEQVKFSKVKSAATYLPYPKSMFAPLVFHPSPPDQQQQQSLLDVHRQRKVVSIQFRRLYTKRKRNYGLRQRQDGNGRTAMAKWLRNSRNVMLETRHNLFTSFNTVVGQEK